MSVELNHLMIPARGARESADFLAHILGLDVGEQSGPFLPLRTSNGVRLDFATIPTEDVRLQHYAFLIPEADFDGMFDRLRRTGARFHADPHGRQVGEINHNYGGRGVYFRDPSGHGMEVITQPYESGLA